MTNSKYGKRLTIQNPDMSGFQIPTVDGSPSVPMVVLGSQMSRRRQVSRQMLIYLVNLSLGIIIYQTLSM